MRLQSVTNSQPLNPSPLAPSAVAPQPRTAPWRFAQTDSTSLKAVPEHVRVRDTLLEPFVISWHRVAPALTRCVLRRFHVHRISHNAQLACSQSSPAMARLLTSGTAAACHDFDQVLSVDSCTECNDETAEGCTVAACSIGYHTFASGVCTGVEPQMCTPPLAGMADLTPDAVRSL
jgi:hypothetical protein